MFWRLFGIERRVEEALRQPTTVIDMSPANDTNGFYTSKLELWTDYEYDQHRADPVLQDYLQKDNRKVG